MALARVVPTDYEHELKRGTVTYTPGRKNYSYHRVNIPGGTVVRDCNFSQAAPNTEAILSSGPITLISCNLCNVKVDPAWTLESCLTAQSWIVADQEGTESR